jgi:hypothetical protein
MRTTCPKCYEKRTAVPIRNEETKFGKLLKGSGSADPSLESELTNVKKSATQEVQQNEAK